MQARVFSPSLLMMSVVLALSVSQPALAIDNHSYWSGYTDDQTGQHNTVNSKLGSVAIGNENSSTARHTFAGGERTKVTGMVGFGYGSDVNVTGAYGTAFGYKTKAEGAKSFAAGYQSEAKGANSVAMGDGSKAEGRGGVALGSGNKAIGNSSFATGNYSKAEGELSFAQGFNSLATGRGAIAMGTGESNKDKSTIASGDYSLAIGGFRGEASGQSSAAIGGARATGRGAFAFGQELTMKGIGTDGVDRSKWSDTLNQSIAAGDFSISMGRITKANANYAIALGNESVADGVGSIALGQKALAQNANALAMGGNAQATLENSIALGEGSVANRAKGQAGFDIKTGAASTETSSAWVATENAMAVGDGDKVTRQITGVAAGSEDTDAVNVAQLKRVNDNLSTVDDKVNGVNDQVTANTTHINQIENRVSDLDSRIDRTGANAAALAALHPLDYDPNNKFNFAGGYGNYRGKNAVAIGAFYRPNPRVMFSVGGSTGGSEHMINAGVSFTLGKVSQYAELSKTQLIETINRQETRLSAQQESLDEQKAKVEALEAQVAELVNKLNKLAK